MRKIRNPFIENKGDRYNCIGCSPHNPIGMKLEFYTDEEKVYTTWNPTSDFEGYHNVLHGGLQATVMDEIASWFVYAMLDTAGVTQHMEVEYHKPLLLTNSPVKVAASLKEKTDKKAVLYTEIFDKNGKLCSSALITYFLFPPALARRKYMYPGKEAF